MANPTADTVVPPPPPSEDPTWMLRLQAQMESLEKAMTSRIAELERELSETKDKLAEKLEPKREPGSAEKLSDEFDNL